MYKNHEGLNFILAGIFILLLSIVFSTFLVLHHEPIPSVAFPFACALLLIAYFSNYLKINSRLKGLIVFCSVIIIMVSGLAFPNDLEDIEEMYLLIPLLYLFILPGTMWPIAIAFALLSAYFPSLVDHELTDWIEDALELIVISSFATIMTYFQQKSLKQMQHFKQDSLTDYLTGLYNRKKFMKFMERYLQLCQDKEMSGFALLSLDLDGFKKINDQLGHLAGDQVLKQVAIRLEKISSESITVFRTGGDEFAFLITIDAVGEEQLTEALNEKCIDTATRIKELTRQPYEVFSKNYLISASVGIACFPTDANDIESLYSNSDLAMYKAKEAGKDGFSFYEQSIMQKSGTSL